MNKPTTLGLHHIALFVEDLEACLHFYTELLDMEIEWQPDDDNIYLSSGSDNLALHRWKGSKLDAAQKLDHIGFIVESADKVDEWHDYLAANNVVMKTTPKTHRDGARSFYCFDPANTLVQFIHHPPISPTLAKIKA